MPEFPRLLRVLVNEWFTSAFAASAAHFGVHRVMSSGVPFIVLESTPNIAVFNISKSCNGPSVWTHAMEEARCLLSFSTWMEPSGRCKLLFSVRGIVPRTCSANGEAEAKRRIARIMESEKCILVRGAEELVTVELPICNEEKYLSR
jgi:hypothetical protein